MPGPRGITLADRASRGARRSARPWGGWLTLAIAILKPLLLLLTRHRWRGTHHVPAGGGVIIAANHVAVTDPGVLAEFVLFGCGRVPAFLAKSSLFRVLLVGRILRGAHQIPVYRERADGGGALDEAVRRLRAGACVVIYPEGTVTQDPAGWPMRARTGVARLALDSGAPVIPVAQWGPQRIRLGRRPVCTTAAGPQLDLSRWAGVEPTTEVLRAVTAEVMAAIAGLVAQLRGEPAPSSVFEPRRDGARRQRDAAA